MANETKGGKQRGKQAKNSAFEAKKTKTTAIKAKVKKPDVKKSPPKPEKKSPATRAKNEEKVKSAPKVTSKKANIKASPVAATRRKKMPKADVYKNRHNIGRRTAGRVHSYKESEVAVVYPDGYWEDLVKSSRLASSTSVKDEKKEEDKEKNCSANRKRKSSELHGETAKKTKKKEDSEKDTKDVGKKVKKEVEEKKKEEKNKKSEEKKVEVKKSDQKTKKKDDDKKKKPESPKRNTSRKDDKKSPKRNEKKPKKEESEPEDEGDEEEEEDEEEEVKPRKPRFADIQPRAPRIKRTACLNANAIVSLMYEREEPVKKPKIDASEAESSDSESLDWEVSFPKWKPGEVKRPPSPAESKKSPKKEKKSKKRTGNGVPEFSPWSPPRRMASLNAQAILTACKEDRNVKKTKDNKPNTKEKDIEPTEKAKESEKPKKKEEAKKQSKTVKTETSSTQAQNGHKNSVTSSTEKSKASSSNKSPEVQIVEVKKSPSSTPLPLAPSFRPSAYIQPPPPPQSSMHPAVFQDYMRYPHGVPSHARSLGTQTSFPLPPSQRHHYPQYAYPGGAPSPYPSPQPQYTRDLWSPHSYGRGDRLPFPQFKDTRQPMRYPTPTPPQSPFHPGSQQPFSPYPAASNVYQPYPAFDPQAPQPIPPAPPKPPQQRQAPQRHCLAPTMPQPPQHHHHATPKAFQCPPPASFSTSANSLPSSSSSFSSAPTAHSSQSQPPPSTSSQREDTKILYNSGGSKFHAKPESKVKPSAASAPSDSTGSSTSKSSSAHKAEDKSPKAGPCSAPNTSSVVMTVCATGAKNSNGATAGGCSFPGGVAQNNNCQPFMLSTISAEGSFPIVPFQQYGTSAFAVPTFEDQQRLTFGYYQPAGPLIQTMPGESVFVQHPIGLQPLHHPQVKVLVHNTGFVPTGVCPDVNESEIAKPMAVVPVDKASDVKKTEPLPHLVPIAPKRPAPVAIAPRPTLSATHVTTVLTQPQPTAAVQAAQPQSKKSAKSTKAPSTQEPKPNTDNPLPQSSSMTAAPSDPQATTASTASSTTATTTTSTDAQTNKRKSDRQKKEPSPAPTKKKKPLTPVVTVTVDPCQPLNLSSTPTTAKDINRNLPPLMINIAEDTAPLRRMSPRLASPNISPQSQISKKQKTSPTSITPKAKPVSPLSINKKDSTPSPNSKKLKSKENKQKNISPNTRSSRASPNAKKEETPPKPKKDEKRLSIDGRKSSSPTPPKKKEKKSMWEWSGQSQQSDNPVQNQKTYLAIKHKIDGDIIHKRDCVLVKSGPRKKDIPFVAKICSLWEKEGEMYMSVFWYYRPEHTETDKLPRSISCELFASKHKDIIPVNCIEDKCYVLTSNEYARYRAEMKRIQDRSPSRRPVVPALQMEAADSRSHRLPPLGADPESVFLCRKVYDVKLKRVLKNPQIHSSF